MRKGSAENRESGQIPERYRHCMRGGFAQDESRSLRETLRRLVHRPRMRESGELLKRFHTTRSRFWTEGIFCTQKNGCGSLLGLPWPFFVIGSVIYVRGMNVFRAQNRKTKMEETK